MIVLSSDQKLVISFVWLTSIMGFWSSCLQFILTCSSGFRVIACSSETTLERCYIGHNSGTTSAPNFEGNNCGQPIYTKSLSQYWRPGGFAGWNSDPAYGGMWNQGLHLDRQQQHKPTGGSCTYCGNTIP
jgi:hypothetical protein